MKSKIFLSLFAVLFLTNIAYAESDCIRANPSVRISPETHMVTAGGYVDYVVEITNNDNVSCGPSVLYDGRGAYNVSQGYTLNIWDDLSGKPKPSVNPGETLKFSMHVQVPADTPKGSSYVEVLAINQNNATYNSTARSFLNIEDVAAPECIRKNPTLEITPENQVGFAGETVKYIVEIKNNDNNECDPSNITFIYDGYYESKQGYLINTFNEFGGGFVPQINTNPGASYKFTMQVTVFPETSKGIYPITITAKNNNAPTYLSTVRPLLAVEDKVGSEKCVRAKPTIKVTPESQTGYAGETSKYIVEVINNDNEFCAPSDISVTFPNYEAESGQVYSIRSFNEFPGGIIQPIKPSASYKVTMLADVFPNTPKGTYYITLVAEHQGASRYTDAAYSDTVRSSIIIVDKEKCKDSDDGKNYYVKGTTTQEPFGSKTDYCIEHPENTKDYRYEVVEYWCDDAGDGRGQVIFGGGQYCLRDCKDGACIKEPSSSGGTVNPPDRIEQNVPIKKRRVDDIATPCDGCSYEGSCLPYGIRVQTDAPKYCELTKTLKEQKLDGSACQNNYECTSNFCTDGQCVNIQKELKETKGLLQTILDFLKKLFNFG